MTAPLALLLREERLPGRHARTLAMKPARQTGRNPMSTTINNEAWAAAYSRYADLLALDRALLDEHGSTDMGEEWEAAHDLTSAAIDLLIDTPALTFSDALTKLRVVIRHCHLEGASDDISDPSVRDEALADPMRDGPWPLLRVLEDLERMQAAGSPELAAAALTVVDFEQQEQAALDEAHKLEEQGGVDPEVINASLYALDRRLAAAVDVAKGVRSGHPADHRHKAQIVRAILSAGPTEAHGLSSNEMDLVRSLCADLADS